MKAYTILGTTVLILALITISITTATAISCNCGDICVNETGWWRDGGFHANATPIQAAVGNAAAGETICVKAGDYNEAIDIETAHLTLAGEGADVVNVTSVGPGDHVFEVADDYVNISGFNVTVATGNFGIYLNGADYCNISDNTVSNNKYRGIYLDSSSNNILLNNTASKNDYGIELRDSSNNTLTGNTASGNYDGIDLYDSSNNLIYNNYWDNTNNAYDDGSNRWNITTITAKPNIIGGPSIGGNYWSNYNGTDTDGDGLGEETYDIGSGNFDYHPLCPPSSGKGDLNGDGIISPVDATIALRLAATDAHDDAADVSGDGQVTSLDALMILQAAAGMVEL